jgi:hypothetical protein
VSRRAATRLAWGSAALTIALLGFAIVFGALTASPASQESGGTASLVASVIFVLVFSSVGALVASRRPGNPIGWIMCLAGLAYGVGGACVSYVESLNPGERGSLGTAAEWVSSWVWMIGIGPVVTLLLLLFPSGRLPSPRWRPVAAAGAGGLALLVIGIALTPGRFEGSSIENPLGVSGAGVAAAVGSVLLIAAAPASIASLVVRYRHGHHEERQQLKWLTWAGGLVGSALGVLLVIELTVSSDTTELSNTLVTGSITAVPLAIGVAILRHGLYDVDVVINRTLVYGALTASLAAAYLGTVLLLQLTLSPLTEDSGLAVAGSTLAVAALFRPLRTRIQELVDRRFFRSRYDAAVTLAGFGSRVRDEVDLDALGGELRSVVSRTMQPAHVSLWLRAPGAPR